ncbi:replication protein [Methylococcaceae bacterium HT1]|nr:replication protein [Methylococcaceae bacterium HT1]TXL12998.1 replication protein [Methylococcaceae bacterium HT4]TXL13390.1 replication protein [Methylococcaceae bacterium HT3]TXL18397.1 replication protein [Methylococcaceae bacterium HT5]TXL21956.1 replication protein [Methylococcaceae bacterium HT2]
MTDTKQPYVSDNCETYTDLEDSHEKIKNPELASILKKVNRSRNYRKPPIDNKQLDIFEPPPLTDISTKDEISLMDIAVFGLGRKPRFEPIEYNLKDAHIMVQGGTNCGMATIFDYDIFLYMISYLTNEMNRIKKEIKKGNDDYLPPRSIKPSVAELLNYCRRDHGGENYKLLEKSLERLSTTKISITKVNSKNRRNGMFSLIGDYNITTQKETGRISDITISIPEWVYDGIVRIENPTVLTLNPDYFLLDKGAHRFLHRLARKAAGKTEATYSLEKIYERSGTTRVFRRWKSDIKSTIAALKENPLPEYSISWETKGKKVNIKMIYTGNKK